MQPSSTWGTPTGYYLGLNTRSGASDLTNPDFSNYPAFILGINNTFPLSDKGIVQSFIETDTLQLNAPITDWSIAYTAVDNPDLGQNNVGVYLNDPDTPSYMTDPDGIAKIAFLSSYSYTTILDNIRVNIPEFTQFTLDFWAPPYSSSRKIWSPDAAPKSGSSDMGQVYQNANYNGYANIVYSFGIKSLFLEIRIDTVNINTKEVNHYSLKEYDALTAAQKAEKPISKAYALVYRRADINGIYSFASGDHRDNFRLILSEPLHGANDGGGVYDYYINTAAYIGLIEPLILPIFGNYKDDITDIRYNITENAANLFYGCNMVDNIIDSHADAYDRYKFYVMQGTDDNIEWIRKTCAAYGLFFCEDINTSDNKDLSSSELEANNGRWLHNDMYLGIIEDNGYTQGRYTRGLQNGMQTQFNWTDSTESIYDPDVPPTPPSPYDTRTVFNDIGNIASLTRRYALTAAAVEELGSELWTISADLINNIQNDEWNKYTAEVLDTFLVNDPLSCIVSLQKYPMSLPEQSGPVHVKLGKAETNIEANITSATTHTYAFTPQLIQPKYGNSFLDYEPYTHMELYVPFCGTISLDPRDYLGHYLNIRLVVDFTTGTCVAYVMSDDLVIDTVNGSLAVSIPVTGIDSTTLAANITNGIINTRNARYSHIFGTLGKIASPRGILSNISNVWGSAEAILSSEENARAAEYSLSHQTAPPHTIGSASPVGSWAIDFSARLLIYYPTGEVIDNSKEYLAFNDAVLYRYMDQVGIATIDPVDNVGGKYRGLVAATAPVLENMVTASGEPATDPELQLIARALEEGIII